MNFLAQRNSAFLTRKNGLGSQRPVLIPQPAPITSLPHSTGLCRPCAWFWKPGGCQRGEGCRYCHICPEGMLKKRRRAKLALARPQGQGSSQPMALMAFHSTGVPSLAPQQFFRRELTVLKLDEVLKMEHRPIAPSSDPGSDPGSEQEVETSFGSECFSASVSEAELPQTPLPTRSTGLLLSPTPERDEEITPSKQPPQRIAQPKGDRSQGSALHMTGACRPCAWFWKLGGCLNGKACHHCHLCPERELKSRKRNKVTMMRLGLNVPTSETILAEHKAQAPTIFKLQALEDLLTSEAGIKNEKNCVRDWPSTRMMSLS